MLVKGRPEYQVITTNMQLGVIYHELDEFYLENYRR